jgi:formate/nitrite transporter FocA (FNT family)
MTARKSKPRSKEFHEEVQHVEERSTPPTPVIYEIVRRHGDEELQRPAVSLWWSGIAAGVSISFSLLAQAILETHIPDAPWKILITSFGYCVGFLMAVLARQQLFTESTITAVLPLTAEFTFANFSRLIRLWAIVLAANVIGTLAAALFCSFTPVLTGELLNGMLSISRALPQLSWPRMFFGGISAGFLMAAMVWLMPGAESSRFQVITLMTYLIAIGGFPHIVAGSMEAFLLIVNGEWGLTGMLMNFAVPVLLGNMIGGTALFAVLSYAQVMKEI